MACLIPTATSLFEQRARTHYQLLGVAANERDSRVIEEAALRLSGYVRVYQLTRAAECSRLLSMVAMALDTLLNPDRRVEYDKNLGLPATPAVPTVAPKQQPAPVRAVIKDQPCKLMLCGWPKPRQARGRKPVRGLVPCVDDRKGGRSCDVEVVFHD